MRLCSTTFNSSNVKGCSGSLIFLIKSRNYISIKGVYKFKCKKHYYIY